MTRYRLYRDVLGPEVNQSVLAAAIGQEANYEHSRVSPQRIDPAARVSRVVYGDRLTALTPAITEAVECRLGDALPALGIPDFERAAYEIQLTCHNDGEFFHRHTDSGSRATVDRTVSFVYYFHHVPKGHRGGELVFFDGDRPVVSIDPPNDSLVLFDPRTPHEVRPVCCPSKRFEDGRFTLNGWIRRPVAHPRSSFAFDQRIFGPVATARTRATPSPAPRRPLPPPVRPAAPDVHDAARRNLLALYGELHRRGRSPEAVAVRTAITGEEFFEEFYCRNRPVLLAGLLAGSDAVRTWTPEFFARRFGSATVEITTGRDRTPDYERRLSETLATVTMAEFVDRLTGTGASNDFYLVARNYFFDREPFRALRNDVIPPADIIDSTGTVRGAMKLWFGPQGTVTPMHFDEHSILFVQIYGRKEFKLVPAFDYDRMYPRGGFYSEVDPLNVDLGRHPRFAGASVSDVEVGPGDALLLPAGWWHWARSRSISISTTFSRFAIDGTNTSLARG